MTGALRVNDIFIKTYFHNEPPHDKTSKIGCATSEDSDQPRHPPSLIRVCCLHEESLGPLLPNSASEDSDPTGQMPRLACLGWAHMPLLVLS